MITLVQPVSPETLRPLVPPMSHHLILESILAGGTRAAIYADDPAQPSAALCRYKDRFYLLGEPDSAFGDALTALFEDEIFPQATADNREACGLYPASENWLPVIEKIAAGRRHVTAPRRYFRRDSAALTESAPQNFAIQPIDVDLLAQTHLQNLDILIEELQSERDSVGDFLKRSFGVCALADDAIAGLCTSEYNTGTRCEVGIMTMEAYQRQGIATALTHALATAAAAHGITEIGWHCWARNIPSVATALKSGFTPVLDYPAHILWFAPPD